MQEKKTFSEEQESAICTRDRTLLVSAAAGSGKTTTLTERIIRSLLDEQNPESIQNMLIVTFTNASVYDLKEKISEALRAQVRENPENKRLEEELFSLEGARIMTIDSFCAELVRHNAERIGVNPAFRIAETAEALILERAILLNLTEAAYEGRLEGIDAAEFELLCDALTGVKNTDTLADKLILLYEKTKSMVKGIDIFFEFANNYLQYSEKNVDDTPYARRAVEMAESSILYLTAMKEHYCEPLISDGDEKLGALAEQIYESCDRLERTAKGGLGYSELRRIISEFAFPKAVSIKNPKPDIANAAIDYRKSIKDNLTKLKTTVFSYSDWEWQRLYKNMAVKVDTLAAFLKIFSETYFEEKKRRGCLEFSDIERLAYECLWDGDSLTDIALSYREQLTSVYIDEYQDVNELQNKIFEAVSPPRKRFMVGDIKQSIYGFRSARPEIFAEMKSSFPPLSEGESPESSIFMSNNYRCDEGIVDFVNEVFEGLFGAVRESIGYVSEDRLKFKKKYKDITPEYERAKICLVSVDKKAEAESEISAEAEFIADRITELIKNGRRRDGSPITPSDIAIISRTKKKLSLYREALERRNIKASAPEDKDFFMNKEILLTLSLLSAIDNPRKDIHLAALMCSPLYSFTPDELFDIKNGGEGVSLYDAAVSYSAAHPEYKRLSGFLSELSHYRTLSEGMNVDLLLTRLYQETGLLSLASLQGGMENLYKLYSYARRFEGSAYKGLYNFITYINNLIEKGATIDTSDGADKDEGAVHIGSIHSSKGLEFPVVFLADASAQLLNLDTRERIAFSEDFGISFLLRAPMGLALVESPLHHIIHDYMNKKFTEEIIRLLYVALTRAKEKLFIVGACPEDYDGYIAKAELIGRGLNAYSVGRQKSYLDMIFAATRNADIEFVGEQKESWPTEKPEQSVSENAAAELSEAAREIETEIEKRFKYVYPRDYLTSMPEKMSVSRLSPTVLDGTDEGEELIPEKRDKAPTVPAFISESEVGKSAKRGIATHYFLQFFDIERIRESGALKELDRLTERGFLSEKTRELVRVDELRKFERSELLSAMEKAKNLYREFRFNTRLPAELFTDDEEKKRLTRGHFVLVQGVIDCLIENEDGSLRLIDYKTDRLTREEIEDEELARKKLTEKHSLQLSYYALAVQKIFGRLPTRVEVYSLPLGKTVSVK